MECDNGGRGIKVFSYNSTSFTQSSFLRVIPISTISLINLLINFMENHCNEFRQSDRMPISYRLRRVCLVLASMFLSNLFINSIFIFCLIFCISFCAIRYL